MISLSRRTHISIPFRGEFESHMLGYYNRYIDRMTCYHLLSVHNLTHLEIPLDELSLISPNRGPYERPIYSEGIVLDMNLDKDLTPYLKEGQKMLRPDLDVTDLWAILENLAITKDRLREALRKRGLEESELRERFLLIRTGWREKFYPKVQEESIYNLGNPYYECSHPYLIHPYLCTRSDVINYIMEDLGCEGIAVDSPSVNHPLLHLNNVNSILPLAYDVLRHAQKIGQLPTIRISEKINTAILERYKKRASPFYFLKNMEFNYLEGENGLLHIYPFPSLLADDWGIECEVWWELPSDKPNLHLQEKTTNSYKLSRSSLAIVPMRGFMRPEQLSLLHMDTKEGRAPSIHFVPPHSTTHLDIYYRQERDNWFQPFIFPKEIKTVVVDISHYQKKLETYLVPSNVPFGLPHSVIKPQYWDNIDKLEDMLDDMEIKPEDLARWFSDVDLQDVFLVFHTGWDIFLPTCQNLNSRDWELRHAYLCHPYLSLESTDYLIGKKIAGIATDAPLLENPIIYAGKKTESAKDIGYYSQVLQKIMNTPKHKAYIDILDKKHDIPCRTKFVQANPQFLYLKHIKGLDDLFEDDNSEAGQNRSGRILIVPLASILPRCKEEMPCYYQQCECDKIVLGLPCEVFFLADTLAINEFTEVT